MRYIIPSHLWQLKALFGNGLKNFNKFSLKTLRLTALQRLVSNLFRSFAVGGKNNFSKSYVKDEIE